MVPPGLRERVEKLRAAIDSYRYAYHVLDKEEIPIEALDALKHELAELESQYPELLDPALLTRPAFRHPRFNRAGFLF